MRIIEMTLFSPELALFSPEFAMALFYIDDQNALETCICYISLPMRDKLYHDFHVYLNRKTA